MARWRKGEAVVQKLLEDRHLERVTADEEAANGLALIARHHIDSGRSIADADLEGAFALAYDAARKAATSLLAAQGLRPTTSGGHLAVVYAIEAQFPDVPGLASLDRLRRRRNETEYPDSRRASFLTGDEVDDALARAGEAVASADRLLASGRLGVF